MVTICERHPSGHDAAHSALFVETIGITLWYSTVLPRCEVMVGRIPGRHYAVLARQSCDDFGSCQPFPGDAAFFSCEPECELFFFAECYQNNPRRQPRADSSTAENKRLE